MGTATSLAKLYHDNQSSWLEVNNVNVNTLVRIKRSAKTEEAGWPCAWVSLMDLTVGQECSVWYVDKNGVKLSNGWQYPFFVLEVV